MGGRNVFARTLLALIAALVVSGLTGCGLFPQKQARVQRDESGLTIVTYPAELRGAYVVPKGQQVSVCSEPAPDVALSTVAEISGKLAATVDPSKKLEAEAAAKVTTEAMALAGRTQLVLIAREMLYSLCTVSQNTNLDKESVQAIYLEVANVIKELAIADRKNADRRLLEVYQKAQDVVMAENSKVDRILEFVAPNGVLEKSSDGKLTRLEALFTKLDAGSGQKVDEAAKTRLRAAKSAEDLRRILTDIVDRAIEPLFAAISN